MTLREALGADVQRVYEQVDALLDREDGLLMLFDGERILNYAQGFGVSPCQLELLSVELERAVRGVVGQPTTSRKNRRNRETSKQDDGRGSGAVLRQHVRRHDSRSYSCVVDIGGKSIRADGSVDDDRRNVAGRVLRVARTTA